MRIRVDPKLPPWVSIEGLPLRVQVSFTIMADGTVAAVYVQRSSGYPDVDSAVVDALSHCQFNVVADSPPVKGTIPYLAVFK